jgi:hypothetical protein
MKRLCGWWLTPFAVSLRLHPAMFSTEQCFFHGGLTPPALTLQSERLPAKKRFLRCTNAHSQERRASARRGVVTQLQLRTLSSSDRRQPAPGRKRRLQRQRAGFPRFEFAYRLHPTGGLRPPLLRCSANICQRKNDFCGARTHIRVKSGGRQPAVVSKNASAMAGDFRGVITFATARPASAPRLAYASRSWLYAGSSSYMHGCDLQRCFVSHGGLTPPAPVAVRTFAGEKTIFAMHERTFTRAAGVSPPWCVIRTMCGKNGALFG